MPPDVARFMESLPPDPMFTALAHSVTTIQPLLGLARALYTSLELPARTRELAILTLANEMNSSEHRTRSVRATEAAPHTLSHGPHCAEAPQSSTAQFV
jgi:hypothetical protein